MYAVISGLPEPNQPSLEQALVQGNQAVKDGELFLGQPEPGTYAGIVFKEYSQALGHAILLDAQELPAD